MNLTKQNIDDLMSKGLPTIEIEKEWVENKIRFKTINGEDRVGVEKIPKYKVGDEIYYKEDADIEPFNSLRILYNVSNKSGADSFAQKYGYIKLKIISETETHWKVQMVR
ncbi:MAG: hypothetical protein AABY10_02785 [Nanoarchaeota archaeon]|mgnify:CR=1 FL=1